jgi:hypothetical protein
MLCSSISPTTPQGNFFPLSSSTPSFKPFQPSFCSPPRIRNSKGPPSPPALLPASPLTLSPPRPFRTRPSPPSSPKTHTPLRYSSLPVNRAPTHLPMTSFPPRNSNSFPTLSIICFASSTPTPTSSPISCAAPKPPSAVSSRSKKPPKPPPILCASSKTHPRLAAVPANSSDFLSLPSRCSFLLFHARPVLSRLAPAIHPPAQIEGISHIEHQPVVSWIVFRRICVRKMEKPHSRP